MKRTLTLTMITDRVGIRTWIWDTGYKIRDTGYAYGIRDMGYGIWDTGCTVDYRITTNFLIFQFF